MIDLNTIRYFTVAVRSAARFKAQSPEKSEPYYCHQISIKNIC